MKPSPDSPLFLAEEVRVFFRKGAHDVQNLFHLLNLWLSTDHEHDKAQAQRFLAELRQEYAQEIDRLQQSFDELMAVHTAAPATVQIRVADVVADILAELDDTFSTLNASVKKSLDVEAVLYYPEAQLRNAIIALLDNALRYRKPEQKLVIHLSVRAAEKNVVISIRDNGVGVDTLRYRDQLFAPFVRCTDRSEGQGISLHLVKTMVEQYGGEIELLSEPGEGTAVTLFLKDQSPDKALDVSE